MDGPLVCMVVKNQLWNDARVKKESRTLRDAGYSMTIIAKPEPEAPYRETVDGITVIRPEKDSAFRRRLRSSVISASERDETGPMTRLIQALRRSPLRRALTDIKRDIPFEYSLYRTAAAVEADIYHSHDLDALLICVGAIFELDSNPDERRRMGARERAAALDRYNWHVEEKKLARLYRDIAP
ncbi:hypothetical protein GF402_08455 [Candidatus Fermentibacteria bacterium]|nr:hypothetical protein [Candidatus Fermentibacteria bacterium]